MFHMLSTAASNMLHACTDFDAYFTGLQRRCFKGGKDADCGIMPSIEEARHDFSIVRERTTRPYVG